MKPEDFITEDMEIEGEDYDVRDDGTIVAVFYVQSDNYDGELQLTKEEVNAAMKYAEDEDYSEVVDALFDSLDIIARAEREPDPKKPDLGRFLFGDSPKP